MHQKLMKQWPNLKKDWVQRIGDYLLAELNGQEEVLRAEYEVEINQLQFQRTDAAGKQEYEAEQRDKYAMRLQQAEQERDAAIKRAEYLERTNVQFPVDDMEILLFPNKAESRTQYVNALTRLSNWLDQRNMDGSTMLEAEREAQQAQNEQAAQQALERESEGGGVIDGQPEPIQVDTGALAS